MDSNIVTAGAAVMGSLVGGVASVASTWFAQTTQSRRDRLARLITRREALYAEFIDEASQRFSDALTHEMSGPESITKLWGILSCVRLSATDAVVAEAEKAVGIIATQYTAKNLSPGDVHELSAIKDPLKRFSEACRAELNDMDTGR